MGSKLETKSAQVLSPLRPTVALTLFSLHGVLLSIHEKAVHIWSALCGLVVYVDACMKTCFCDEDVGVRLVLTVL